VGGDSFTAAFADFDHPRIARICLSATAVPDHLLDRYLSALAGLIRKQVGGGPTEEGPCNGSDFSGRQLWTLTPDSEQRSCFVLAVCSLMLCARDLSATFIHPVLLMYCLRFPLLTPLPRSLA